MFRNQLKIGMGATVFVMTFAGYALAQDRSAGAVPAILVSAGNGGTIALPTAPAPPRDLVVEQAAYIAAPAPSAGETAVPESNIQTEADRAEASHAYN